MSTFDRQEILQLADAAIEGKLDPAQKRRLEQLVLGDSRAAELYVNYVAMSATLRITHGAPVDGSPLHVPFEEQLPIAPSVPASSAQGWKGIAIGSLLALSVVASIVLLWRPWPAEQTASPILARLVETKGCRWGSGTLPTEAGAELVAGRLKLSAGLARIVFSSGVEVLLESPAEFELLSRMKCRVSSGKLVASVPEGAQGFVVETPTSVITDFGTEFGVSVGNDTSAVVQVFKGRVDTWHRPSGDTAIMQQGDMLHFRSSDFGPYQHAEPSVSDESGQLPSTRRSDQIVITTADSGGKDAFIQSGPIADSDRQLGLLLVKRPVAGQLEWERQAYLGFDLSELAGKSVVEAQLSLTLAPTGLGFASHVPDATFYVYGLVDGAGDIWHEDDLNWSSAPTVDYGKRKPAVNGLVWLGEFNVPQGEQSGTVSVASQTLVDLLNADTNHQVTFVVARHTAGIGRSDLVHGFASRRHGSLPAPTLRVTVAKK